MSENGSKNDKSLIGLAMVIMDDGSSGVMVNDQDTVNHDDKLLSRSQSTGVPYHFKGPDNINLRRKSLGVCPKPQNCTPFSGLRGQAKEPRVWSSEVWNDPQKWLV